MLLIQHLEKYFHYWKWFLMSITIALLVGFVYLRYAQQIYAIYAKILLQDEKRANGEMAGLAELANLAGRSSSSAAYVNDQMQVLQSRRIMRKVVEANKFTITYHSKGLIRMKELLEKDSPLKLILLNPNSSKLDSISYQMIVSHGPSGYSYTDKISKHISFRLGEKFNSPLGEIMILPQSNQLLTNDLIIQYIPREVTVDILRSYISIQPNQEVQSFVVDFAMRHPNKEKGKLLLNSLIEQYNLDAIEDKISVFKATNKFIDSRLDIIAQNLQTADSKMEKFKQQQGS